MTQNYAHNSHRHCFDQQSPACGLKGHHCCLCDIVSSQKPPELENHPSPCPVGIGGWSNSAPRPQCTCKQPQKCACRKKMPGEFHHTEFRCVDENQGIQVIEIPSLREEKIVDGGSIDNSQPDKKEEMIMDYQPENPSQYPSQPQSLSGDWEREFDRVFQIKKSNHLGNVVDLWPDITIAPCNIKSFISRVRNQTLEDCAAVLESLKVNTVYPVTKKFSRKSKKQINVEQRNSTVVSAQATIRSLKK